MPTYVYETTDPAKPVRRFEVKQSMRDEPLRVDPKTGESVRRVISGGYGVHVPEGRLRRLRRRGGCGQAAAVTERSSSLGDRPLGGSSCCHPDPPQDERDPVAIKMLLLVRARRLQP